MESFGDVEAFGTVDTVSGFFSHPYIWLDFFGGLKGTISVVTELRVKF